MVELGTVAVMLVGTAIVFSVDHWWGNSYAAQLCMPCELIRFRL